MARQKHVRISTFLLSAIVSLVVGMTAASAQNVPATAREAAKLPQYASRLAHATAQQRSPASSTAQHRAAMRMGAGPASGLWRNYAPDGVLYDNGPINGTTDAWGINFGFVTTDSFSGVGQITGLSFGAWLFPGDVLQSVEVLLGSSPFGGDVLDQVVSLSQNNCSGNQYGFNVCVESGTFNPANGGGGWVTLQNATVNTGDPAYWDENSGPSMAEESSVGTIPSEAFTLQGGGGPPQCGQERELPISQGPVQPAGIGEGPAMHHPPVTAHWTESVLHAFGSGADGSYPGYNGLISDAAGNLYGTTPMGGTFGCGIAFEVSPSEGGGWTEKVLHNFNGRDGWFPFGSMTFDGAGNLYGATTYVGVFELSPAGGGTWTATVIHPFNGYPDGSYANGGMVFDSAGNLYGTTGHGGVNCTLYGGCGTVYELSPVVGGGWTEKVLHSFDADGVDGIVPLAGMITDAAGNLYGTTSSGGTYGKGTVFELSPDGQGNWTETILYSFGPLPDGEGPWTGALTRDAAGNLYGTTQSGGTYNVGTVFELTPNGNGSWTEKVLYSFGNGLDGFNVLGGLIFDGAGNLYGTTEQGGDNNAGTVFVLSPTDGGNWRQTVLYSFCSQPRCTDGYFPFEGVIFDAAGNLFGLTDLGGAYGSGTVFELRAVYPCIRCSHVDP